MKNPEETCKGINICVIVLCGVYAMLQTVSLRDYASLKLQLLNHLSGMKSNLS